MDKKLSLALIILTACIQHVVLQDTDMNSTTEGCSPCLVSGVETEPMSTYVRRQGCMIKSWCRCQCNGTYSCEDAEGPFPGCNEEKLRTNETIVIQERGQERCVPIGPCKFGKKDLPAGVSYKTLQCVKIKYTCKCTSVLLGLKGRDLPSCVSSSSPFLPSLKLTILLIMSRIFFFIAV